jgi:Transposase DDE domain
MCRHGSQGRLRSKIHSTRGKLIDEGGAMLREVLSAEKVQAAVEGAGVKYRQCLFTPLVTLWAYLAQVLSADGSCREAVAKLLSMLGGDGPLDLKDPDPETGPYCKARKRLPLPLVTRLTRQTADALHAKHPAGKLLGGRPIKVVDGTVVSMPDTPANQKQFPQPTTQKPGLGFPMMRVVAVMSLHCGAVLDIAFGPYAGKQSGESAMLRALFCSLDKNDVLLGDRYYASYWMIAMLQERGVDSLFRQHQHRKIDFRKGTRLGRDDHLIALTKPSQRPEWMTAALHRRLPSRITVREVRVRVTQPGCRVRSLVLVTTLLDMQLYKKQEIAEAFRLRWHVELDLRSIKQTMGMSVLRCKTPEMVRKEVWMHLLAYNLIRTVMARAAEQAGMEPREVSFAGAMQTINAFTPVLEMADAADRPQLWEIMLRMIGRHRVANRPGRYEPRAVKRRAKPIALLTVPRDIARARLAKAGATK